VVWASDTAGFDGAAGALPETDPLPDWANSAPAAIIEVRINRFIFFLLFRGAYHPDESIMRPIAQLHDHLRRRLKPTIRRRMRRAILNEKTLV
jgi:hypothetical protein